MALRKLESTSRHLQYDDLDPYARVRVEKADPEGTVLLDSPHSGSFYPSEFEHACSRALLRSTEDALVHELFAEGPRLGATLIHALFARSFIDVNRSTEDLDAELVEGTSAPSSEKALVGIGLIWRHINGVPIYSRQLTQEEVRHRVAMYWRPYRETLNSAWDSIVDRHGFGVHLNCHSMPSRDFLYQGPFQGVMPYDFIVGNRGGTTASKRLTQLVVDHLRSRGWKVAVNLLFSGADIVKCMGAPVSGRHSVQLEINRALYLEESSGERLPSFFQLKDEMTELVRRLLLLRGSADL